MPRPSSQGLERNLRSGTGGKVPHKGGEAASEAAMASSTKATLHCV